MMNRTAAALGLVLLLALAVAGCGGGGTVTVSVPTPTPETEPAEEASTEEPTEAVAEEPAEEVGGPLSYVGTITGSGEGTAFKDTFRLGPLLYGQELTPPVLSACPIGDSAIIDRSVFARGEVTIKYEGSLPETLIPTSELVKAEGEQATLGPLEIGGQWLCGIEELINTVLEFQPGESQTLPFWVVDPGALSNERPRLSTEARNAWYFNFMGRIGNQTNLTISGPGKGWCEEIYGSEWRLFLYNRSGGC